MSDESRLEIVSCTLRRARAFVQEHHRHHRAPQGGLFALAVARGDETRGVVIVGRPVARNLDDGRTAEVTRLCTLGDRNACSMLYAAARRAAAALGYPRVLTYILGDEPGTSLRAAGWRHVADVKGQSWSRPSRGRTDKHPVVDKQRWEAE